MHAQITTCCGRNNGILPTGAGDNNCTKVLVGARL
jgi:hypothetical protein